MLACAASLPGDALHDGRMASITKPAKSGENAEDGKRDHRGVRPAIDLDGTFRRTERGRPRKQSQRHARNRLPPAPPQGEQRADAGRRSFSPNAAALTEQNGLKEQPFRRKSIKRRSAEIAAHATRNAKLVTGIGG